MFLDHLMVNADRATATHSLDSVPLVKLTRRAFIAHLGVAGSLVLGVPLMGRHAFADATAGGLTTVAGGDATPSLFIAIEPDGTVEITCHRSEMGQQVWTSMAQIIADELDADWDWVTIVQAEGHPRYGDQNTDGSRSVRNNLHRLRVAGAAMRAMLVQAAATQWEVPANACRTALGIVEHAETGRRLDYGTLASAAAELLIPNESDLRLKDRSEWRYIGKPTPLIL